MHNIDSLKTPPHYSPGTTARWNGTSDAPYSIGTQHSAALRDLLFGFAAPAQYAADYGALVGRNTGLIRQLAERVFAIDVQIHPDLDRVARRDRGIAILLGDLTRKLPVLVDFSVVWRVIHLLRPEEIHHALVSQRNALVPGGLLFGAVRTLAGTWAGPRPTKTAGEWGERIDSYFTRRALVNCLQHSGFEVLDLAPVEETEYYGNTPKTNQYLAFAARKTSS